MVNEIMRGVNHSQYGEVLHLLGASPQIVLDVGSSGRRPQAQTASTLTDTGGCCAPAAPDLLMGA
eukprot:3301791-Prymnesium_polylepis.2